LQTDEHELAIRQLSEHMRPPEHPLYEISDRLQLAGFGLLQQQSQGKHFVFRVPGDLSERLNQRPAAQS
jgi:hypothetical protein